MRSLGVATAKTDVTPAFPLCHSRVGGTKIQNHRHPDAGRGPLYSTKAKEIRTQWIPAYAGMTVKAGRARNKKN